MQKALPARPLIWMLEETTPGKGAYAELASKLSGNITIMSMSEASALLEKGHRPDTILMQGRPGRAVQQAMSAIKHHHPTVAFFVISHWSNEDEFGSWISQAVIEAVQPARSLPASAPSNPYQLSQREIEVLRLMTNGLIKKEIAETLSISYHTIVNHERSIYNKLNVHTRSAAVAKAFMERLC